MAKLDSAPRIYCIPAANAPVVAVFRRGPTDWAHIGRWNLTAGTYESGAWLRARIFPRRSDLSPDGLWLSYFAHDPRADWEHGEAYVAVSRLPWLKALHAFGTCGTWTRGYHFTEDGSFDEGCQSGEQESVELPIGYGLRSIPSIQFANERRRGWAEASDSPPRVSGDMWDERRNVRMQKRQPGGGHILRVESLGRAGGEFGVGQAVDGLHVLYSLESNGTLELLENLQWADWDSEGRLLVATRSGQLHVRSFSSAGFKADVVADLSLLEPDPGPAPAWAETWNTTGGPRDD